MGTSITTTMAMAASIEELENLKTHKFKLNIVLCASNLPTIRYRFRVPGHHLLVYKADPNTGLITTLRILDIALRKNRANHALTINVRHENDDFDNAPQRWLVSRSKVAMINYIKTVHSNFMTGNSVKGPGQGVDSDDDDNDSDEDNATSVRDRARWMCEKYMNDSI